MRVAARLPGWGGARDAKRQKGSGRKKKLPDIIVRIRNTNSLRCFPSGGGRGEEDLEKKNHVRTRRKNSVPEVGRSDGEK